MICDDFVVLMIRNIPQYSQIKPVRNIYLLFTII